MEILQFFSDFILHIDDKIQVMVEFFGNWSYVILFLIIFAETGLIIMPFLPGDSLLFAIGAFSAPAFGELFDIRVILISLFIAAVIGDTVNYWIGRKFGQKIVDNPRIPINQEHVNQTQAFYDKNGGKTIILARFIPIIRTFAPFVAGVSHMRYKDFMLFNVVGGFVWVFGFTLLGYFLGSNDYVKEYKEIGVIAVIAISLLPVAFEFIKIKFKKH
jgi:membrane-associated protein